MIHLGWVTGYVAAGAGFWLPSVVVHAVEGGGFGVGPFSVIGVLVLPVLVSIRTLDYLTRKRYPVSKRGTIALWMLLGIWLFGPLCMMISASFSPGGGFYGSAMQGLAIWDFPFLIFPGVFMMSAYDGTLGALVIVTIWFIIAGIKSLSAATNEPPSSMPFFP